MDSIFFQHAVNAISLGAIYALFALGYALVFSILGVLNLAHSAIFMWGTFIGLLALDVETAPVLVAFIITVVILAIPYFLVERYLIQRVRYELRTLGLIPLIMLILRVVTLLILWGIAGGLHEALVVQLETQHIEILPIVALALAMLGSGVISVILEYVAFRPLRARNAERLAQLISSIGAALVLVNIAQFAFENLFNNTEKFYPNDVSLLPFIPTETLIFDGLRIQPLKIVILVVSLILMAALQYMVNRTQLGQQMRAVAFNDRIANLLGIDVSYIYVVTFFMAGLFGGAGGMLFGLDYLKATPFIGQDIALIGLTAIVLGGLGSIRGALVGGFVIAAIQTFSIAVGGSDYRNAVVFILLFGVLLVRPQGLLGQPEQNRA